MQSHKRHGALTSFVAAGVLLAACGGGGGGSGPQVPLTTVSGTVAANAALAGYSVSVYAPSVEIPGQPPNPAAPPATGAWIATGTTGPDGRYSATSFMGTRRPFVIGADESQARQYRSLLSISHRGGSVNVTPLTTLLVARLLNRSRPDSFQATLDLQNRTEADVSTAQQQVLAYLLTRPRKDDGNITIPVDVSAVTDFAAMPLTAVPGDPHFDALKLFHNSLMDSESIQGVQEHMLFGNEAPADLLAMLTLDFMADCTGGPTRIILDRSAITLGSVALVFQTGDQLHIETGPALDNRWVFTFAASQASVELSISAGRLTRVTYAAPAAGSTCTPQSVVSLAGKHPGLFGLIGLLRQSVSLPREFQCAGPITFPGFLASPNPNVLLLDPNGAARVNGPGGPSLHLPSLARFFTSAPLVVVAGQVSPIRLTSFTSDFSFLAGSFDQFTVQLTDTGQITGLSLTNAHSNQAQHCGI